MRKATQRGFTVIELLVVLVLMGIMMGLAVPAFREFIAAQRVKNTAFDFAAALLLARSEAVKRNTEVAVQQSGGDWQNGWAVSAGGATLSTKEAPQSVTITPNPAGSASVAYQGTGRIANTISFQFASGNTKTVRCVTIGVSGVPNTTSASCS